MDSDRQTWQNKKGKAKCISCCGAFADEVKLFLQVTPRNQKHEEMLGKQISQVSLYNMSYEVKDMAVQLTEEKKENGHLRDQLTISKMEVTALLKRLEKAERKLNIKEE